MAEDRIPLCLNASLVSLPALSDCDNRKDYRHYQSEGHGAGDDALSPGSSFATRDDVFSLQRRRLAVFLGAGLRQPSLSGLQIFPTQNKAIVLAICLPLDRAGE
jgi:hypothetical protein